MKQYIEVIKKRIGIMVAVIVLSLTLTILTVTGVTKPEGYTYFSGFVSGFQSGLLIFLLIAFAVIIMNYTKALKDETKLKKLYLEENDELSKMISEKTGGRVIYVCAVVILFAGIVSAYFNEIIFFTLISCSLFLFLVKKILLVYYKSKY